MPKPKQYLPAPTDKQWGVLALVFILVVAMLGTMYYVYRLKEQMAATLSSQKAEIIRALETNVDRGIEESKLNTARIQKRLDDLTKVKPQTDKKVSDLDRMTVSEQVSNWNGASK